MTLIELGHDLELPQARERYLYWEERRRKLSIRDRRGRREAKQHASIYAHELRTAGANTLPRPGLKYTVKRAATMFAVLGVLAGGASVAEHSGQVVKGVGASVMQTAEQTSDSNFVYYPGGDTD